MSSPSPSSPPSREPSSERPSSPQQSSPQQSSPQQSSPQQSSPQQAKPRPWYLVAAMCLMWLMGVAGMLSGCEEMDYLRGSQDITRKLARDADAAEHPVARTVVAREQARVEALGRNHRKAFPLAALSMLVGVVLIVGAGGALAGRPRARVLALQAIAANAAVAAAAFVILAEVRYATAHAVAADAVEHTVGVPQGMTRDQVLDEQHAIAMQQEQLMVMIRLALFGAAAIALTRRRTKQYFASMQEPMADG